MNTDDDIFRIFSALDDQNQGYIDKGKFLNTVLDYTKSLGDLQEEELNRIKHLMDNYEKIHFKEFKEIYLEIQFSDKTISSPDKVKSTNSSSSNSSDIDDSEQRTYQNKLSLMASPGSARRHGLDLLNQSRASIQRMVSGPIQSDSDTGSLKINTHPDSDEWDEFMRENEKKQLLIESLQDKLEEEDIRFQNEREQNKVMSERIYELESQIHDIEMKYKSEIKRMKDEYKMEIENVEEDCNEQILKLNEDCSELRQQLNAAQDSRNQMQSISIVNDSKYDDLVRDYRLLQSQLSECENTIFEYKRVASGQITELQSERDQLELVNKDLYIELQAFKHLNRECHDDLVTESHDVKVRKKQRVQSAVLPEAQNRVSGSLSMDSAIPMDSIVPRNTSPAIESDIGRVVHLLTIENRDLVERIAHLETVGFYQKQRLEAVNCLSLADEMERLNLEETRKALSVERETVKALRDYMEAMTIKLLTLGHIDVFQQ